MATAINVAGPHKIKWGAGATAASAVLGRGDNNDLFRIEMSHKYVDIQTNEFGDMPAESIMTGITATINFSLVSYDTAEANKLQVFMTGNGAAGGEIGKYPAVGTLTQAGHNTTANDLTVNFELDPDIANRRGITVFRVRPTKLDYQEFGNKATRLVFAGEILPDVDTAGFGSLYTFTTT